MDPRHWLGQSLRTMNDPRLIRVRQKRADFGFLSTFRMSAQDVQRRFETPLRKSSNPVVIDWLHRWLLVQIDSIPVAMPPARATQLDLKVA